MTAIAKAVSPPPSIIRNDAMEQEYRSGEDNFNDGHDRFLAWKKNQTIFRPSRVPAIFREPDFYLNSLIWSCTMNSQMWIHIWSRTNKFTCTNSYIMWINMFLLSSLGLPNFSFQKSWEGALAKKSARCPREGHPHADRGGDPYRSGTPYLLGGIAWLLPDSLMHSSLKIHLFSLRFVLLS